LTFGDLTSISDGSYKWIDYPAKFFSRCGFHPADEMPAGHNMSCMRSLEGKSGGLIFWKVYFCLRRLMSLVTTKNIRLRYSRDVCLISWGLIPHSLL